MQSYTEADAVLTGRCRERRKVANNTWLERRGDDIAVRLHATDIVTYRADGAISLNTGGWFTVTTKARMCEFTPFVVGSNRGEWYVVAQRNFAEPVPYRDGMTWHPDRGWSGVPSPDEVAADRAERKALDAKIKAFVAGITPERIIHAWENTLGDCFICRAMSTEPDHLLSHVEEDYFHASLVHLMLHERRVGNPDYCMSLIYHDAQRGEVNDWMLTGPLRKFLRKHLTTGVAVAR
jgi:hypothetical protein